MKACLIVYPENILDWISFGRNFQSEMQIIEDKVSLIFLFEWKIDYFEHLVNIIVLNSLIDFDWNSN